MRRLLLPYILYPTSGAPGFYPSGFYFYEMNSNTLDIFLHFLLSRFRSQLLELSDPLLRVLFSFNVSDVFGGGSEVVRKFSQSLPRDLVSLFHPISSGISDIHSGSSSVLPLVWRRLFLGDLDHPKVLPDSWGFSKFWVGLLHNFD